MRQLAFRISDDTTIHRPSFMVSDGCGNRGPPCGWFAGSCSANVQGRIQRIHEFLDLDRLGEIAEESCVEAFPDVVCHGIGADREDRNVRRMRSEEHTSELQ